MKRITYWPQAVLGKIIPLIPLSSYDLCPLTISLRDISFHDRLHDFHFLCFDFSVASTCF